MTVNERLFAAGLLDAFDESITSHDRAGAIRILEQVEIELAEAESIVSAIEKDPAKYGYAH